MKRGEIWWVNFDPSVGGEIRKRRPATVSKDRLGPRRAGRVTAEELARIEGTIRTQLGL